MILSVRYDIIVDIRLDKNQVIIGVNQQNWEFIMGATRTRILEYERTHPWIKFSADLQRAPASLWVMLGEARSKCQHLAGVALKPSVAHSLHQIYLAKGALATAAIEGNTLTEKEALAIVQEKSQLPKSQAYLKRELENIVGATNLIMDQIEREGGTNISEADIKKYNKQILEGLKVESFVVPGEYVKMDVAVAGYHAAPWKEASVLIQKLCDWLNGPEFRPANDDDGIHFGILKAILAHLYLVWIHPFGDGNGRTARLMEVRFLAEVGVPSTAAHLLSNHYNKTRTDYYRQLREASQNGGDVIPFLVYAVTGLVDGLREQLAVVKLYQWNVSWINYVHEQFRAKDSVSDKRQLKLVLALADKNAEKNGPVPKSEMKRLTPQLAEMYAVKTDKTLSRDINTLEAMGLIERTKDGYRAKSEVMLAFLPRLRKGGVEDQIRETARLLGEEARQLQLDL